jgi:hypothetical protein
MGDQLLTAANHREVGRQLARMTGVELDSIPPHDARLWEARGEALQALATGDMDTALRTMGLVSSRIMDRDEAREIASNAVAVRIAAGWTRDMLVSSTESGRAPCGRGYYLFCSGAIAVCYFPMVCITDMNGRGYHFHIAQELLNERDPSPYAIRRPTVPQQLEMFRCRTTHAAAASVARAKKERCRSIYGRPWNWPTRHACAASKCAR